MIPRRGRFAAAAAVIALTFATVSIDRGRTLRIVDVNGAPVPGTFVVYHHEGSRLNPAHSTTYDATGRAVARSGAEGTVRIPFSVHVHLPFPIETNPHLWVDLVYAPSLHNGLASIGGSPVVQRGASVAADLATATLADLSDEAEQWQWTLMNASAIISRLIEEQTNRPPRRQAGSDTMLMTRSLVAAFSQDYRAFLARHGSVPRPRPVLNEALRSSLSADERQRWEEMTDRDLAREPRWGDVARRLFDREVAHYTEFVSTSP